MNKEYFKNKKAVIILSGGMDSTTLLHYLVKELNIELYPLSFNYGQKHNYELEMAKWQVNELKKQGYKIHDLKIVEMSFIKNLLEGSSALIDNNIKVPKLEELKNPQQPLTYVPFRNLIMLSIALSYAEAKNCEFVFYGAQKGDEYGYWDTTLEFVKRVNKVADLNREHKIKILAPFVNLYKWEELFIGKELKIDYSKTWTCYNGPDEKGRACGECPTCKERIKAFATVGIKDPIPYKVFINWEDLFKKYKTELNLQKIKSKIEESLNEQLND
jgi:7-cyano-7-deazaguanine synthase